MLESKGRVVSQEVREYLSRALPTSGLEEVGSDSGDDPLLLLTMPQLIAGFGFASQDIDVRYGELYGAFKHKYSMHRRDWDRLELAFVMCVPANSPGLDFFGSSVETDVYFCRKYVVPFNEGPVGNALARLPFVPLFSGEEETIRPPTAQTFLQQCGVPPTLARYVVVKGERSPETIVNDCMNESFGKPAQPARKGSLEASMVPGKAEPMRVASLEIENFRAYRKKQEITFGEDLTVLYGPNGFGKTSVFDAVDFAFTGDIGRLKVKAEDSFRRVANHLDGYGAEGIVTLSFAVNGHQHRLVRHVNDRRWPNFDGERTDRKSALKKLTGWRGSTADRVENMVSLFRATHLFSQEHQELASNFRADCELSSDVVSRLLAFEDYHAGRSKVAKVCVMIRNEIMALDDERGTLQEQLVADEGELESMGRATDVGADSEDWKRVVSLLYEKVEGEGLDVPSGIPDLETLRGWRMTFEARATDLREQMDSLRTYFTVVERLPRKQAELAALETRLEGAKVRVKEASRHRQIAEEEHRDRLEKVGFLGRTLGKLEEDLSYLKWIEESLPEYLEIAREDADARSRLNKLEGRVQETEIRQRSLSGLLREVERERAEVLDRAEAANRRVRGVKEVLAGLEAWVKERTRQEEVVGERGSIEDSVKELLLEEHALSESIEALVDEEGRLAERIEALEDRGSELSELVKQIEDHIDGSVCPVCGEDHGNPEKLLDRIAEHLGEEIAKEERLLLDGVRKRSEQLDGKLQRSRSKRRRMRLRQRELAREGESLETAISAYERSLAQIEVNGRQSDRVIREELEGLFRTWEETALELESRTSRILAEVEKLRRDVDVATEEHNTARGELERLESDRERIVTLRQRLADDPRAKGELGLDAPLDEVLERKKLVEAEIRSGRGSIEDERQYLAVEGRRLKEANDRLESEESNLGTLLDDVAILGASCREMEATLADLGIADGESEDEVLRRMEALENQAKANNGLLKAITRVELVVDAATTKAAFSQLRRKVGQGRSKLTELREARESFLWWLEYFEELLRLLSSEQDKAVSRFTRGYGPRTSAIQRRLRSVYGFDDVEIQSEESKISVRVSRQGVQLRPTDYFSQSQQQTLLLGLFLTASVSQTWSAMAPVFLDDPVTHFDDLNTYAFLDLIDGLLNDHDAGGRQFVVSTCDEKFLQLARQKFAYRKDRARFYTFKGIGEEGPIVV